MQQSTFQRNALASALALALFSSFAAAAQDQPQTDPNTAASATSDQPADTAKDRKARTLDTVTVTGSRIKRAQIEGPTPVAVITAEQMKKEGFATVYDALRTIPAALGNVENPSNWGRQTVNAYPLNLRALGPGRTLLLINGHRVTDYPMPYQGKSNFANFNNIPTGIVERIEVLTGAASAIYGSDAMGGVINVILKKNMDDHVLRAKWGEATRGGRINKDFVFSGGASGDNWNLVYNLQHFDRGTLLAKDRPFMDAEDDKNYAVWNPAERAAGHAGLTPSPLAYLEDSDAGTLITPPAGACDQYGKLSYESDYILDYDRTTKTFNSYGKLCAERVFRNWALRTGSKDDSGYLYGTYDFDSGLQAWASLGVWHTTGGFAAFLPAFNSPYYWDPRANSGAGGTRQFYRDINPDAVGGEGFLTKSHEKAWDFSAGLRGTVFNDKFDWEAMVGRAEYEVNESFPTRSPSARTAFFMGPQQGTFNGLPVYTPDYNLLWNPLTPEQTSAFLRRGHKKAESWLTQAQFVVSGDLFEGWAGPIGFAGVLEAGKQGYKLTPEPKTLQPGCLPDCWSPPFGQITQGGGTRNRYAVGTEFRVPLLKSLTSSIAARYDKYDAVRDGAKVTYQGGLEWRPVQSLLVRGTYGTTFRAPDMHYVYALPSSGVFDYTDYRACADAGWGGTTGKGCPQNQFKIENATTNRGGTPDLKYEEGKAITYGVVWDAFENFSTSLDYWKMEINNAIGDIDENGLLVTEAECTHPGWTPDGSVLANPPSSQWCEEVLRRIQRNGPANVAGNVTIGINPINRAEQQVSGLDYTARYALPDTRIGNFDFALNYTWMLTYKSRGLSTEKLIDDQKNQTRAKYTASVNWSRDKWNATLMMYAQSGGRDNRWGGCEPLPDGQIPDTAISDTTCVDNDPTSITFGQTTKRHYARRPERRYFNGSVGYQLNDAWKFNLYVSNIFDRIYGDKWCGDFTYCVDNPVGREVSGEVIFKF